MAAKSVQVFGRKVRECVCGVCVRVCVYVGVCVSVYAGVFVRMRERERERERRFDADGLLALVVE